MAGPVHIDPVRLQDTLDDVSSTVAWAVDYIEVLHEDEHGTDHSDLPGLKADLERLRLVADSIVPGRVRDVSGKRWYLAPDEAARRPAALETSLDDADDFSRRTFIASDRARRQAELDREAEAKQREQDDAERQAQRAQDQTLVRAVLAQGPSTVAQIVKSTGLTEWRAETAAKTMAKRGRDRRFVLGSEQETEP